jgi:hypothetical protein
MHFESTGRLGVVPQTDKANPFCTCLWLRQQFILRESSLRGRSRWATLEPPFLEQNAQRSILLHRQTIQRLKNAFFNGFCWRSGPVNFPEKGPARINTTN